MGPGWEVVDEVCTNLLNCVFDSNCKSISIDKSITKTRTKKEGRYIANIRSARRLRHMGTQECKKSRGTITIHERNKREETKRREVYLVESYHLKFDIA